LLVWSIKAALSADSIDQVYVSTDSREIAEVAKLHGADVIERPAGISGDMASSETALLHALEVLAEDGHQPEVLIFLQCTSPLTLAEDIDGAVALMNTEGADSAFTACRFVEFLWRTDETGAAGGINHDMKGRQRRQDRAAEYLETGAVYVMQTSGFLEHKHRFFGRTVIYEVPKERSLQIDDPGDLVVTGAMMSSGMHRPGKN